MSNSPDTTAYTRASTGVAGLDEILGGGLPVDHLYLLDGEPGTGKTTLALQFLLAGAARGARGLYVTLSESRAELLGVASSHGWSLEHVDVFELASETGVGMEESYTIFHPAEVELQQTIDAVLAAVERHDPSLVVFDSLSEMRLLARDPLRFRRQILTLKQFFAGRRCTVLLLDDKTAPEGDLQLHSLAHGVIVLEHIALEYGAERRRLQVTKLRGLRFRGGYHDFRIRTGGIAVYPRIHQVPPSDRLNGDLLGSGSPELDTLLGGGIQSGTSLLVTGPAGTGKSVLVTQYACAAVERGEHVRFFMFDERLSTFRLRSEGLGMNLREPIDDGRLCLQQVEPTELSPGEFANQVVRAVEEDGVRMIVIDSINGYLQSMPEERLLPIQVHELLSYLANAGVTTLLTLVQHGIFGSPVDEAAEVSYLADAVILLRYFEVHGAVKQAVSVVKKRTGDHERTIRECRVERNGLRVGEPLREFQGVLTGVPHYTGTMEPLLRDADGSRTRPQP
ncbi:Circadian clock protein KaiC central region [Gemmatirosa kalamazoonensis]|uniref:non-specific serine/threonine protein kinase n=1 Tax=Gemmatirosa kalamazoonensis TaxID=861299 RepID=W0RE25_9BACT|nr:ATPase domain-containing protein [Gemmatirosa kalamazoonensis]AHG88580.1 Circadian clock protein KaiC central region [Gemmatirosa kalamazoonensis]